MRLEDTHSLRSILAVIRPESAGERRKSAFRDAGANPGHELLIEADIMLGHQHSTQYFPRFHQMMQVSAAPGRAYGAAAPFIERPLVLGKAGIADVQRYVPGKIGRAHV